MGRLTMSNKEVPRAGLLKAALLGKVTNREGANALGLSVRQFQRLKVRFRQGGESALLHQGRGRSSERRLPETLRQRVAHLLKTTYAGFSDVHLTEKLTEIEKLSLSRESVRKIRLELKLPAQRRRRPRKHRSRRLREARMGALVQVDGSPHAWLEDRGPEICLVGSVDDATGALLGLTFRPNEDLHGYAVVLKQMFTTYGLPLALYGDGTGVFVRHDSKWTLEEELRGRQNPTHLRRVLDELGIDYVRAYCPQGKGRVENRWGTLQDRLISELRLRGISTLEKANDFLPAFVADFNRRFARPPREVASVWRRPPRDLARILSCRYTRTVARDNTVDLRGRRIQIPPGPRARSYAGVRVDLRELLDGRLMVFYRGENIATEPWPRGSFVLAPRGTGNRHPLTRDLHAQSDVHKAPRIDDRPETPTPDTRPRRKPAPPFPGPNHPWRRSRAVSPRTGG
jgi:transposase